MTHIVARTILGKNAVLKEDKRGEVSTYAAHAGEVSSPLAAYKYVGLKY